MDYKRKNRSEGNEKKNIVYNFVFGSMFRSGSCYEEGTDTGSTFKDRYKTGNN